MSEGAEQAAPLAPLLRVVKGEPTAEELAALTVVVAALSQRRERRRPDAGRRLGVLRRARHRRPLPAGPGGWLAAGRSGVSSDRRLVLASASPARLSLLRQAGLAPEVVVSDVDESAVRAPRVAEQVALLAAAKAAAVAKQETDALVIGADSLLEFDGKPLGKPADAAEARDRWRG